MTIGIDAPPVEDESEGLALMIHYLALASAYFEATPENADLCLALMRDKLGDHALPAAEAWFEKMVAAYPDEG